MLSLVWLLLLMCRIHFLRFLVQTYRLRWRNFSWIQSILLNTVSPCTIRFWTLRVIVSYRAIYWVIAWFGNPQLFRKRFNFLKKGLVCWSRISNGFSGFYRLESKKFAKACCHSPTEIYSFLSLIFWHEICRMLSFSSVLPIFFYPFAKCHLTLTIDVSL